MHCVKQMICAEYFTGLSLGKGVPCFDDMDAVRQMAEEIADTERLPEAPGEAFPRAAETADGNAGEPAAERRAESEDAEEEDAEDGENAEGGEGGEGGEDAEGGEGGEEEASPLPLASVVEAVLFAARDALKLPQIARACGRRVRQDAVRSAMDELNVHYLETGRAFEIAEISGRFQLMSRPEFAPHIMKLYPKRDLAGDREKTRQRLTATALDTLAIIAYKQPVTRAEIEHIRGVGCGPVLKTLMERDSIKIVGKRAEILGQPLVYGTTENFLAEFGLGSLDELPMRNDFLTILGAEIPPVAVEASGEEAEPPEEPPPDPEASAEPGDGENTFSE